MHSNNPKLSTFPDARQAAMLMLRITYSPAAVILGQTHR